MQLYKLLELLKALDPPDSDVYVYIKNECYYPIQKVSKDRDGNIIIECKDIKRREEDAKN